MFTREIVKDRSSWIMACIIAVVFGLFFVTGCGDSSHSYYVSPAEVDPCEATPIDLVEGFGDYDFALYVDCEDAEVEVWLGEEGEIVLETGFDGWPPFDTARAFGVVTGPRSFELTEIQIGFWIEPDWWWWGVRYWGFALGTLCNDTMTLSDFDFEGLYLICDTATFWELRGGNGIGDLEGIEGPFEPGTLFAPIENLTSD